MKYFTYKVGDDVKIEDFTNPLVFSLFKTFQEKIDYNENKWDKRSITSKENGKKGGRPKNNTSSSEEVSCGTLKEDKEERIDQDKVERLEEFLKEHRSYVDCNDNLRQALSGCNPKLNNFFYSSGITESVGEQIFNKVKNGSNI